MFKAWFLAALSVVPLAFVAVAQDRKFPAPPLPAKLNPDHGLVDGVLLPDTAILAEDSCPERKSDELELDLGGVTTVATHFPHTVIAYKGAPKVVLYREDNGSLTVGATFSSAPNVPVAALDRDKFEADPDLILKFRRPSSSRLVITGQDGTEILNVWFENKTTMKISGQMYFGSEKLSFQNGQTQANNITLSDNCLFDTAVDIALN